MAVMSNGILSFEEFSDFDVPAVVDEEAIQNATPLILQVYSKKERIKTQQGIGYHKCYDMHTEQNETTNIEQDLRVIFSPNSK